MPKRNALGFPRPRGLPMDSSGVTAHAVSVVPGKRPDQDTCCRALAQARQETAEMTMKLDHVPLDLIDANPANPRGIADEEDDKKIDLLRQSIAEFGVLVPLLLKRQGSRYLLIDGQRRYWAAKGLKLKDVPAYVSSSDLDSTDILLRMFHVHHNREQWGPIPQCRALENLYNQICRRRSISDLKDGETKVRAIAAALEEKTGLDSRTATDRVLFLRWPSEIKQKFYETPTDDYWYVCEIEKGIILPALRNYPEYFEKVSTNEVRRDLLAKLQAGSVVKATEVRVAARIARFETHNNRDRKKVLDILGELRSDHDMTYQDAADRFDQAFPAASPEEPPSPRRLVSMLQAAVAAMELFDPASFDTSVKKAKAKPQELLAVIQEALDALRALAERVQRNRAR